MHRDNQEKGYACSLKQSERLVVHCDGHTIYKRQELRESPKQWRELCGGHFSGLFLQRRDGGGKTARLVHCPLTRVW